MSTSRPEITGKYTNNGTPRGYTSLTPFLAVRGAREAISFYRDVFEARLVSLIEMGGQVSHAELDFGDGRLQLGEADPQFGLTPQPEEDATSFSLTHYCQDADALLAKAEAAGATVREPLSNFISGDRFASIRDPFGVRWSLMTRIEDLSDEESSKRVGEWAAHYGG
ncbi:Glyoxalase-like domain protein [Corynebacterium occultum]|uniref:Glyoxalase-like domain protein n=1 Tax=Corynebacterium occultum TaxID=2675219 RepID=A0A6B8WJD1_9CORY|nr:VOC family protein [Corynebacterium occultum]QGU06578.1 Glyoxalase-like domain protein [Corynebacterium occultum]